MQTEKETVMKELPSNDAKFAFTQAYVKRKKKNSLSKKEKGTKK